MNITDDVRRVLDEAEQVLGVYERRYPGGRRPHIAVAAARNVLLAIDAADTEGALEAAAQACNAARDAFWCIDGRDADAAEAAARVACDAEDDGWAAKAVQSAALAARWAAEADEWADYAARAAGDSVKAASAACAATGKAISAYGLKLLKGEKK